MSAVPGPRASKTDWFRQLIESTEDPITVVSARSGRLVGVNSAFATKTGFKSQEIIGKTPAEIGFLQDLSSYDNLLRDPVTRSQHEFEVRTSQGDARCAQTIRMAIEVAGQPCLIIIWRDITERKQFENDMARARDLALESARLKTEFLNKVSHELRTPLNGIIGMSELLIQSELPAEQREYADVIERSSRLLFKTVSDILDFSKVSSQQLCLEEIGFEPREVVRNALAAFTSSAAAKGLKLSSSFAPGTPDKLRGDPYQLGKILMNLVGNAVKFTDSGEVAVAVAQEGVRGDHVILRFEVRDTGIGISAADQKRLFQPFVQVDGSTTRKYGGTGLGLAICADLVEQMKGKIDIFSASGQGSKFFFTAEFAPTRAVDQDCGRPDDLSDQLDEPTQPNAVPDTARAGDERASILIVEDNPVNQMVLRGQLQKLGYKNVTVAGNGCDALQILASTDHDLVFMDCEMPVMDGLETTACIRRNEQGRKPTVVIAVTAHATEANREKCFASGMNDYVVKPVRLDELSAVLKHWGPRTISAAARSVAS